jgi:hypothetical protein
VRHDAEKRRVFYCYHDTNTAAVHVILTATPSLYLKYFVDNDMGFAVLATHQMIIHFKTDYCKLTATECANEGIGISKTD